MPRAPLYPVAGKFHRSPLDRIQLAGEVDLASPSAHAAAQPAESSAAITSDSVDARHANAQGAYILWAFFFPQHELSHFRGDVAAQRATGKISKFTPRTKFVGTSKLLSPYTRSAPSMMVLAVRPPQPWSWLPKKPT